MESNKDITITIKSYQTIWDFEKKTYTIFEKIPLPVGVSEREFVIVAFTEVFLLLIWFIFNLPFPGGAGCLIIFFIFPASLARFLKFMTFDGKNPILFVKDYIRYFLNGNKYYEFFRVVENDSPKKLLEWNCGYRRRYKR